MLMVRPPLTRHLQREELTGLAPPAGGPFPHVAVAAVVPCEAAFDLLSDPGSDAPDLPRRWAVLAPVIALAPLVTYRLLEFASASWTRTSWGMVAEHTLPPLAMLGVTLALWRRVPPLPGRLARGAFGGVGVSVAVGVMLGTAAALMNLLLILTARAEGGQGVASIDPGAAALVVHVVLLAPLAEEVTFRGLIYRIFRQSMLPRSAILLSALIFGLMHVELGKAMWAFLLGLVAAAAYEQTRSLLTPFLIHGLFNAVPIGVAVLRAKPDDTGPIWLVLAVVGVIFSVSARSAQRSGRDTPASRR